MHHSGCTPRQPTPFEIRTMRPTISRPPRRAGTNRFDALHSRPLPRTTIQSRRIARIRRRALTRVAASPTEGPDDVQRCNDGAIINRWYRHAYASHATTLRPGDFAPVPRPYA